MTAIFSLLVLDDRLRKWRTGLAFLLYALILILGSIRGARAELGHYATGIILHSLAYGGITMLLFTGGTGTGRQRAAKAVLIVMAMGALDEALQSLLSFRTGAVSDWLVDCTAAIASALLLWAILPATPPAR